MVKNFIKTALRSLRKNKLTTFINIFGLSLAIGCSLVVYVFVDFAYNQDTFHENRASTFLLKNTISRNGAEQVWGDSPAPIGEMLLEDFPQIKHLVRIDGSNVVIKNGDNIFNEYVRFADPAFLEVFTFPLEEGDPKALEDPSKVIISKKMAEKYFGKEKALGQVLEIVANDKKESFVVGGVAKKFPKSASFAFGVLINFEKKFSIYEKEDRNDWTDFIGATFIQLNNPDDIAYISSNMDKYIQIQNQADEDWPAKSYTFEPMTTLSLNSHAISGDISGGDDPTGRMVLLTIAGFMMALACFNYINISISTASKRLKEIGIRKVIGGTRFQLIFQFIGENLIICFFALILGAIWARTLFGPWFNDQFDIGLELNFYENINAWLFMTLLLLITGVGSGAYPSLYVSSFSPVSILRGKQTIARKNVFTKVFLTFQFVLSIITIVFGITFSQNAEYQKTRDWGYNQAQTLVIPVADEQAYKLMFDAFSQNSNIASLAGSANHLGKSAGMSVIEIHDNKFETRRLRVGHNYLETFDIRLKKGRLFEQGRSTDLDENVVVNETFVRNMGWEDALNQKFSHDTIQYNVIGVVEDFHYYNFDNKIEPAYFAMAKEEDYNFLSLKVKKGGINSTEEQAKALWKEHVPDSPYTGFFQDQVFERYFQQLKGHGRIMGFTAVLAIILSCMGLFGLVSINVAARMKEFSIRKVLGAGVYPIFNGINKQYIWLISIACIIGIPISYFMVSMLFTEIYEYHMPLTAAPFVVSTFIIFGIALATVSTQIYKVIMANPVDALRDE